MQRSESGPVSVMPVSRSVLVAVRPLVAMVLLAGLCGAQINPCFDQGSSAWPPTVFNFSGVDVFGLNLFREIVPLTVNSSNLLMSPFSVWSVLALALMGAQGSTREQLQNALGLPHTKQGVFFVRNALDFVMNGLASGASGGPELRRVDRAYFDQSLPLRQCVSKIISNVETLEFSNAAAAAARINIDVSRATGGQIPDLLTVDALVNAHFVLINAIYFKGNWLNKFDVKDTTKQVFYNAQGEQVANVDMMTQQGQFNIVISPALGATMLELPYDKSNISMLILLPDTKKPGVDDMLSALNPYTLEQALAASQKLPVKVFLPKFDLKSEVEDELVLALKRIDVSHMFDGAKANFSDFTGNFPLFADTAIHQAKVKVDEVGTIAAAATALIGTRSGPGQVLQFIANRPFVFLIFEKTVKVTLFAGVIRNPTK